jgi:SAM-dependent methyltransferase
VTDRSDPGTFDGYADAYDSVLDEGLAVSGESKDYFAEGRIAWLSEKLAALTFRPSTALDFGCGTGSATPFLFRHFDLERLVGIDVSARSIEVAQKRHGSPRTDFSTLERHQPTGDVDLAFCNGVFHHIPPAERRDAAAHVFRSLRPGGLWAFWDNNPFNPGTQWIMRRLPFDRDAVKLSAWEAARLARSVGFEVLAREHLFIFPRALRRLRPLERRLAGLPLGAQFQVLCRRPDLV